jgi:hypothetical protein
MNIPNNTHAYMYIVREQRTSWNGSETRKIGNSLLLMSTHKRDRIKITFFCDLQDLNFTFIKHKDILLFQKIFLILNKYVLLYNLSDNR